MIEQIIQAIKFIVVFFITSFAIFKFAKMKSKEELEKELELKSLKEDEKFFKKINKIKEKNKNSSVDELVSRIMRKR